MSGALDILAGGTNGTVARPAPSLSAYRCIPYDARTDPHADIFLYGLWDRMRREGLMDVFFHDSAGMNFTAFVENLKTGLTSYTVMVCKVGADGNVSEHVGLAGLTDIAQAGPIRRALGAFCFFKDYWDGHQSDDAARAILDHWFGPIGMTIVVGITPKLNRPALAFIHRLGFVSVGELPTFVTFQGRVCAGVVSHLTKEAYFGSGQERS